MDRSRRKLLLVGMDALILPLVRKLVGEGHLPNLKRLMAKGTTSKVLPCLPAYTPTNWATIATGARTGTHGAGRWTIRLPDGLEVSCFDSTAIAAETIWEAAERAGHRSGVAHYPATLPSRLKKGVVIDGFGLPHYGAVPYEITASGCYTTLQGLQGATTIEFREAAGWLHLPKSESRPLETVIEVEPKGPGQIMRLDAAFIDGHGTGYDRLIIAKGKDAREPLADITVGHWSSWTYLHFEVGGEEKRGAMRFKLVELSPNARAMRLYRSQMISIDEFVEPSSVGEELVTRLGPYIQHASLSSHSFGWTGVEACTEEMNYQGDWIAGAAEHLFGEGFSIFGCHLHWPDDLSHEYLAQIDPASPGYDAQHSSENMAVAIKVHQVVDAFVGRMLELADEDTYVLVISDHGNAPDRRAVDMEKFLVSRGFMVKKKDDQGQEGIVWEKTRVYCLPGMGLDLHINLRGREPQGVVEPGKEYERAQRDLINELYAWRDPVTGECPIALALKRKDAVLLGFWGDQVGDVVFVYNSGYVWEMQGLPGGGCVGVPRRYGAHHGPQLPTTETGISSNMATMIIAGPDIKRGYETPYENLGPPRMEDIAPTVSYLLGFDPPAQSQGAVLYHILKGRQVTRERDVRRAVIRSGAVPWYYL